MQAWRLHGERLGLLIDAPAEETPFTDSAKQSNDMASFSPS